MREMLNPDATRIRRDGTPIYPKRKGAAAEDAMEEGMDDAMEMEEDKPQARRPGPRTPLCSCSSQGLDTLRGSKEALKCS